MRLGKVAAPVILLALLAVTVAGCSAPSMFRADSLQARDIRAVAFIVFAILSFVLVVVWAWLAVDVIRYRKNPESRVKQSHGDLRVEAVWTLVPALIVGVLFYLTVHTTGILTVNTPGKLDLTVTGHQWWWQVDYPSGRFATANEIHVPVGQTVTATLLSADVIHSFWVPQMGGKLDMVPGHVNATTFLPLQVGRYIGECGEYCGHQHGHMRFLLFVDPVASFDAWFANERLPARKPTGALAVAGARTIAGEPCAGCHTIRGTALRGLIGPDLTHVGSRTTLAAVTITNTPANLSRWIHDPQAVKPGTLMPTVPLAAQQLAEITAYLEELK